MHSRKSYSQSAAFRVHDVIMNTTFRLLTDCMCAASQSPNHIALSSVDAICGGND